MRNRMTIPALMIAAMLLCSLGCGARADKPPAAAEPAAVTEPASAPVAPANEAQQPDGGYAGVTFTSADLNGRKLSETYIRDSKVTVVNFWATWCPPCVGEIPTFSEVAAEYAAKGCAFLGVQCDDDMEAAKALWEKNAVSYPTVLPDGGLADIASRLPGYPVTMLFDGDGMPIGQMHVGAMSKSALTQLLDEALEAQ